MSRAVIVTGLTPDDPALWAVAEGEALQHAGTATSLAAVSAKLPAGVPITVILPGSSAASRHLPLPVKGDKALAAAAALAFEDVLAEAVDQFHFAFSALDEAGTRLVSAVPLGWFETWMASLGEAGLDPECITVDHLALYAEGYDSVILLDGDHGAAHLPAGGISGDAQMVSTLVAQMDVGDKMLAVTVGPKGPPPGDGGLVLNDDRTVGAFYLAALASHPAPSFRRGAFAKKRDWIGMVRPWRVAAGLMAACFTLWLVGVGADGWRHDQAAKTLNANASTRFSQAFPNVVIRDLPRQAAQRAGAVNGGGAFLSLSVDLTEAIEESVAIQLMGLAYTDEDLLVADLRFPDAASLERLKSLLSERGIPTREGGNLRREDNGDYSGRLFLGGDL